MNVLNKDIQDGEASFEPTFAGAHSPDVETERAARKIRQRVMAEIDRLNLRKYVADLEIDGWTILPPEVVGASAAFLDELRETTLEVLARPNDRIKGMTDLDIQPDRINTDAGGFGQAKSDPEMLAQGRIFEQALMNEPTLAILSYLVGENCRLQSMTGVKKGPGRDYMLLHADNNHSSAFIFPALADHANATWILSDYSEEEGSTVFVDGSHKLCRAPTSHEARDLTLFKPIKAKAGSILIHHGNVWHGSVPRRVMGYRVSLIMTYCRWYGHQYRQLWKDLPPEAFERNPPRFSVITGKKPRDGYGSGENRMMIISPFG